jgi:phosphatidylglycerol:prolipoprotein diacylglycerol transferase
MFFACARNKHFDKRQTGWLALAGFVGGIFGAKLIRFLFATTSGASPMAFAAHPDGRTIIGGILGGWVAVELMKAKLGIKRSTGDCFALALPVGEAIGRIGCFLNGCCYGAPSSLPWAIEQHGQMRHPAQIYSILVCVSIFTYLWLKRNSVKREGDLFRTYLVLWASSRFILEFFRERTDMHFSLSMAQWVSLEVALSVGLAMLCARWFLPKESKVQHE